MDDKETKAAPTPEHVKENMKGYQPTDRDFLGTSKDVDNISKSEKIADEEKEENERTEKGNTAPDKQNTN